MDGQHQYGEKRMGPCAVRMGPGAGRKSGCVRGGPCSRDGVGAGRSVRGVEAAAAKAAATARGFGSNPAARDLGSSLEKAREPCGDKERNKKREVQFGCLIKRVPAILAY